MNIQGGLARCLRGLISRCKASSTLAAATTFLLAGCAAVPVPRVIQTPPVCPAPRALPAQTLAAIDGLPERLPELPASAASTDAAAALFINGAQSAAAYQACRAAATGAAGWIRGEP